MSSFSHSQQPAGSPVAGSLFFGSLILGMDTCGPSGSVCLARLAGRDLEILGQIELEGRTYSATLIAAVGKPLQSADTDLRGLGGIVVVNGPGSFTGVRVGLSAAKAWLRELRFPWLRFRGLKCYHARPVCRLQRSMPIAAKCSCGWSAWRAAQPSFLPGPGSLASRAPA